MWQQLNHEEEISIGAEIDAQDQFSRYAGNASAMAKLDLPFYPGAQLIRVTSRQVNLGDTYFIHYDGRILPLRGLDVVQPLCDRYFKVVLTPESAADYFRFAHFFSTEGRNRWLVESPRDLSIDPATNDAEERKAIGFIKPVNTELEGLSLKVRACTVDESTGQLYRDTYLLAPEQRPQLLQREDSRLVIRNAVFVDRELKIGRADPMPLETSPPEGRQMNRSYSIDPGADAVNVSFSADECVTLKDVFEKAHHLESDIVGVSDGEIARLAEVFARTALIDGRKSVTLTSAEIGEMGGIFLATTSLHYSPLKNSRQVCALEDRVQEILRAWPARRNEYELKM